MTTVMVFGTFDGVHEGHRALFRQARQQGDRLVVVVARDGTVEQVKGRKALHSEEERRADVAAQRDVDEAILGNRGDKFKVISDYRPDVICLGYDQDSFVAGLREQLTARGLAETAIVRLEPYQPDVYKSSLLNHRDEE